MPDTLLSTSLFVLGLLFVAAIALVAYYFGWLYRAKHEVSTLSKVRETFAGQPLGVAERAAVDLAFTHVEQAFAELRRAKRLQRK